MIEPTLAEQIAAARTAGIREGRRQMREEAAKVAERIRQCPFEDGKGPKGISENDPCPVCGDLGTFDLEHPSRCLTAAKEIRALPDDPPTQEPPPQ